MYDRNTVERPPHIDDSDPRKFTIFSTATSAYVKSVKVKQDDGSYAVQERKFLAGTASSNVKDRQGDTLDSQCQASMLGQATKLAMWLNHDYTIPESILGMCSEASLNTRVSDNGEVLDLDIEVMVDEENPRAVKSWRHVNNGTRLAFSIGGIFKSVSVVEPEDDDDWMAFLCPDLIVHDLELLEISLVGIPANPRAYTKAQGAFGATKGLHSMIETEVKRLGKRALKDATTRTLLTKSMLGDNRARKELEALPAANAEESAPVVSPVVAASETPTLVDVEAQAVADAETEAASAAQVAAAADARATETATFASQLAEAVADANAPNAEDAPSLGAAADANAGAVIEAPAVADVVAPADADANAHAAAEAASDAPLVADTASVGTFVAAKAASADSSDMGDGSGDGAGSDSNTVSPISDVPTQKRVVKAMRAVKRMTNHGMCTDSMANALKAHGAMKSLLPEDYEIPADADIDANSEDEEPNTLNSPVTDTKALDLEKRTREAAADVLALETTKTALAAEVADLNRKLEELRAKSVGRMSASPSGSRNENESREPAWDMDPHARSVALAKAVMGVTTAALDARDSVV